MEHRQITADDDPRIIGWLERLNARAREVAGAQLEAELEQDKDYQSIVEEVRRAGIKCYREVVVATAFFMLDREDLAGKRMSDEELLKLPAAHRIQYFV